jgi:hypothetical protein
MINNKANHHYVSRCHLKQFTNDDGIIFIYDKEKSYYYSKKSTKRLFSEQYLNSRVINGEIDNNILEDELNDLIENNFNQRLLIINQFLMSQVADDILYEALNWLALFGVIGELRHPKWKQQEDKMIERFENDLLHGMNGYVKKPKITKYQNINSYFEMAMGIIDRMGELKFQIVQIVDGNEFVIPDTSCFQIRGQLKKYFNPDLKEIMQIGLPLTKKLFINCSSHLCAKNIPHIQILNSPSQLLIDKINSNLISFAYKGVACSNSDYLKNLIDKQGKLNLVARK